MAKIFGMLSPMIKPEMRAASRMPVPVALTQFRPNTAGSLVGLVTTGGTRSTRLLRPATGNCGLVILLGGVCQVAIDLKVFSGAFMKVLAGLRAPQENDEAENDPGNPRAGHFRSG